MRFLAKRSVCICLVTCLWLAGQVSAQPAAADTSVESASSYVLTNATLHTGTGAGSYVGSIVISDGVIQSIGKQVEAPKDATVIDLQGCHLTPGLIESRGKLWLTPAALSEANTKAELNVVDALDPWSEDWRELASQGVTSVYVQPGSASLLGGYGAVLRVGPHSTIDAIVIKDEAAVQVAIGTRGTTSRDRYTQIQALEKLLAAARKELDKQEKAATEKDETEESTGEDQGEGQQDEAEGDAETPAAEDSEDEDAGDSGERSSDSDQNTTTTILIRILKKEVPVFAEIHHSDSLRQLLALAQKYDFRLVLDGLSQVESCCQEIKQAGYPVVVGPLYESALGSVPSYRQNANYHWMPDVGAGELSWSLSNFASNARESRLLRTQAATAVGMGLDRESVLAAITSSAARMLGVAEQVGTLEVGKQADIAVFAGDPLDPSTSTRLVMSHGVITFDQPAEAGATSSIALATRESAALPERLPAAYAVKTSRLLREGHLSAATLIVRDGKVVSAAAEATGELPVFDLGDAIVTPGLVNANALLGQAEAILDATDSDSSHLRAIDAIDPSTKVARKFLQGGFVHIAVSPGTGNTSAGLLGHLRLGANQYVVQPALASQFTLTDSARKNDRFPASLNGQVRLLNELFQGRPAPSSIYVTADLGQSLQQEKIDNIQQVKQGKRKALIAANSDLEIRSALALVEQQDLSAALISTGRVGEFARQLAEQKMGLIVGPLQGGEFDAQLQQVVIAQQAGVPLAFAGDSPETIRITAATLVSRGVPRHVAWSGLTEGGAQVVGMQPIGLTAGADADFVVWSTDPLNPAAKPLHVIVAGQTVSE